MKTPITPLGPMSVKRKKPVTVLVVMTNLMSMPTSDYVKKRIKINFGSYSLTTARLGNLTAINQEDEKSIGQYGGLDLDDTI